MDVSGVDILASLRLQVAELANSGALTAPDEAAEITSLGGFVMSFFANLSDDTIMYKIQYDAVCIIMYYVYDKICRDMI